MKFINLPVFIISFAIGLFFVYISSPDTKTVVVFPTPDNEEKVQYVDKTQSCYKYASSEVACPTDNSAIDYSVQ